MIFRSDCAIWWDWLWEQVQRLEADVVVCITEERQREHQITELINVRERFSRAASVKVESFPSLDNFYSDKLSSSYVFSYWGLSKDIITNIPYGHSSPSESWEYANVFRCDVIQYSLWKQTVEKIEVEENFIRSFHKRLKELQKRHEEELVLYNVIRSQRNKYMNLFRVRFITLCISPVCPIVLSWRSCGMVLSMNTRIPLTHSMLHWSSRK